MIAYEVRKGKSGNCYAANTVVIRSLQTLEAISFRGSVVLNAVNLIKGTMDFSRKIFDALKGCVLVARHTAVTIL